MPNRQISAKGLKLLKRFEGLRLRAYIDAVGVLTIGYGSTGAHVNPGMEITEAQAEKLLLDDLARFEKAVSDAAPNASQDQFDAMVSLAFNIGIAGFQKSSVLRLHKAGRHSGAADSFALWVKGGGKTLPGLVRRRSDEAHLYGGGA
jgi:lysozyme